VPRTIEIFLSVTSSTMGLTTFQIMANLDVFRKFTWYEIIFNSD
jgi:hypothetical protein